MSTLATLSERSQQIFCHIVENYLKTGVPTGSHTLAEQMAAALSPASIRKAMAELEAQGLLYAPHISAGRLPTESGLRFFVEGLLQVSDLSDDERNDLMAQFPQTRDMSGVLTEAISRLSGLSACASLVIVPTKHNRFKHIEFLPISADQILIVTLDDRNQVENRLIERPRNLLDSALVRAANYLNTHLVGCTFDEIRAEGERAIKTIRGELGTITARVVSAGLADWVDNTSTTENNDIDKTLIVRGYGHLLDNLTALSDIERVRILFENLEQQQELIELLTSAEAGEGVRIFIGSESQLFSLSGSSLIVSAYRGGEQKIIGVLGVIAPTRSNYARIIPLVDHTARIVSDILTEPERNKNYG